MSDTGWWPGDAVARQMATNATQAAMATAGSSVTVCRYASGKVTALIGAGLTGDVTITWKRPFPNDTYVVECEPGPGITGTPSFTTKSRTTSACVVTVTAGPAIAAGGIVYAHGTLGGA